MTQRTVHDRARTSGRLLEVDPPSDVLGLDELEAMTRGADRVGQFREELTDTYRTERQETRHDSKRAAGSL